jgi:magnesium transporter
VRKKILQLEGTIPMSSGEKLLRNFSNTSTETSLDWIAHGLMDSVVDGFFPVLRDIEKEVLLVEDFVSGIKVNEKEDDEINPFDLPRPPVKEIVVLGDMGKAEESSPSDEKADKVDFFSIPTKPPKKGLQFQHFMDLWQFSNWWRKIRHQKNSVSNKTRDRRRLRRMTATRRLVNTLGRLLSSKAEVIGQIRKRVHGQGEVAIYLGDVLDHIVSLHQSLVHYERMLSHSHPAYLSHLRVSLTQTKGAIDGMLLILSIVGILVPCFQVLVGLGSLNVHVPTDPNTFHIFWIFLVFSLVLPMGAIVLIRRWSVQARRRRGKYRQL